MRPAGPDAAVSRLTLLRAPSPNLWNFRDEREYAEDTPSALGVVCGVALARVPVEQVIQLGREADGFLLVSQRKERRVVPALRHPSDSSSSASDQRRTASRSCSR